jgi:predicted Zn finger-like uncharacterized protein
MFTICPKCALTLAVTAADLRVAQGYVRCGRCSSVFNALARLTDERQTPIAPPPSAVPPPSPAPSAAPPAPPPPPPADEDPVPASEEALEFNPDKTDAASVFVQPKPDPQWAAATGTFKAMVAANQEPVLELEPEEPLEVEVDASFLATIIRTGTATAAAPQAAVPAAAVPVTAVPVTAVPVTAVPPAAVAPAEVVALEPESATAPEPESPVDLDVAADPEFAGSPVRAWLARRGWALGAALAALTLALQLINHNRDALAARPLFNRPLSALYGALGVALVPQWDLHAYDVRQLGASTDAEHAGQITVRASIKNAGEHAQPLPLLRVTLQDRFGNRVAARDVQPQFYLPGVVPASALLGAGQRIDAEMAFVDPGASAVGFELDACLPVHGGVACANDPVSR